MKQVHINTRLLSNLNRVLRVTHNQISEDSGIPINTWYRIFKIPEKITVPQLLALANGLHIPVRKFFTQGKMDFVGEREDYIAADYRECYYDSDAISAAIGRHTAISQREAARAVGQHFGRIAETLAAERRLTVVKLIAFCESFDYDIFQFLIDPNTDDRRTGKANKVLEDTVRVLTNEVRQLREQVQELQQRYSALLGRSRDKDTRPCKHINAITYDATDNMKLPMAAETTNK